MRDRAETKAEKKQYEMHTVTVKLLALARQASQTFLHYLVEYGQIKNSFHGKNQETVGTMKHIPS